MSETTPKVVGLGGKGYDPKAFYASAGTKVLYSVPKSSDKFFRTPYNNIASLSPDGVFADYVAPVITGPTSISVNENTTPIHVFSANETVTWSKSGADTSKFTLNSSTGELVFASAPNYEVPTDADGNNIYQVVITATDTTGNASSQTLDVTVLDVDELVTSNLICSLDANNYSGSGTELDDTTSNDFDGTIDGATFNDDDSNNKYFVMDGSNDYIGLGTQLNSTLAPNSEDNDASFSFWISLDAVNTDQTIFSNPKKLSNIPILLYFDVSTYASPNNTGTNDVGGGTVNVLSVLMKDADTQYVMTTANNAVSADTWYNIVIVLNPSNDVHYIYLNGVEVAKFNSSAANNLSTITSDLNIGAASDSSTMDGKFAHFMAYSAALSPSEVTLNYTTQKSRYGY